MPKSDIKMTRDRMQREALIIEELLSTAIAMACTDFEEAYVMIEKAHARASRLNIALDSVHAPEGMA